MTGDIAKALALAESLEVRPGRRALAPVVIRWGRDRAALAHVAARQSRTTHAAPEIR